jgi:hypothetical protein
VPNRIVWSEWEDFITGGKDGTLQPILPYFQNSATSLPYWAEKTLADYFGLPTISQSTTPIDINALPFRAYTAIYNEYFRDQNLSDEIDFSKGSGLQNEAELAKVGVLRNRAWEKDYFTSALPWTQRGPEATVQFDSIVDKVRTKNDTGDTILTNTAIQTGTTVTNREADLASMNSTTSVPVELYGDSGSLTVNELRRSVRLQEWLEKNARGGARYIEQLMSHWGRAPKDARLQRPEYLSGSKQPIVISEVLNTAGSETVDLEPVGQMAGHGISVGRNAGFSKTFDEHGYVIGVMSILPVTNYYQGIPKHFTRKDKLDFAWPEFAQLGEQPILNKEIYFTGAEATADETFGYTPRFSEYKYGISTVHGEFKTNLEFWHMGRKFSALPPLNEAFVTADPTKRIFAVTDTDTDDLYCQVYHNCSAIRALPYYGTPTL